MDISRPSVSQTSQQKKQHRIFDLGFKRSVGDISTIKYKRLAILSQLNYISYQKSKSSTYVYDPEFFSILRDDILGMEVDPRSSKYLLVISRYDLVAIYDISPEVESIDLQMRKGVQKKLDTVGYVNPPNSAHWLWDCSVFSICSENSVQFWDTESFNAIETVNLPTPVLNHIIAAKEYTTNKFVAASGRDGHVFIIDMRHGSIAMTMETAEKYRIRAIQCHPTNELYYVTGNENGKMYLWDTRKPKNAVFQFVQDDSFPDMSSHPRPVIGVRFYNDGNSIISVDKKGGIRTWQVCNGRLNHQEYESVKLCPINKNNNVKEYQFAVTDGLKQDIAFLPSKKGLKIIDIDTGKNLPNSQDVSFPVCCAAYDPQNLCVYGSYGNAVKMWSTENKLTRH